MLACNHERDRFGSPMCVHLRTSSNVGIDCMKWYIGSGCEYELLCVPCVQQREQAVVIEAESVCEECFKRISREISYDGMRGKPEVQIRPEPFHFTIEHTPLPKELGRVIDIAPVNGSSEPLWMLLAGTGQIFRFNVASGDLVDVAHSHVPAEADREPWCGRSLRQHLHTSNGGEFVAVVNDYGRYGQIIDLASGKVTLSLDGGDYHPETVPFSFAFTEFNSRVVAIHRTQWNRLDCSDASTGKLLSERSFANYEVAGKPPEHYLDYFHGAICVNPSGTRVADDGWVWHPVGIPYSWSLERWLSDNVWESEDGPTKMNLCTRLYYWDVSMAWLDDTRIAVAGIGDDDKDMHAGARVFDVTTPGPPSILCRSDWPWAQELTAFAGPAGHFFSDGISLFSSDETGLSCWNPVDGVRTAHVPDIQPTHYHRGARELVQVNEDVLLRCVLK